MPINYSKLNDKQKRRLSKLAKVADEGILAVVDYLFELEEKIDQEIPDYKTLLERIKGDKGDPPSDDELLSLIQPLIPEPLKPRDGEDYVLTQKDKDEIAGLAAKKIKVPVVEKVVERREIVREQPIVTEKTEVREVAVPDTPEQTRDKLESLPAGEKLSIQAIEDLWKILEEMKQLQRGSGIISTGGFNYGAIALHFIDDETPLGDVDGVNTIFTLGHQPSPVSALKVYLNGQRMKIGEDYTVSGKTITFITPPPQTSIILCDYRI